MSQQVHGSPHLRQLSYTRELPYHLSYLILDNAKLTL